MSCSSKENVGAGAQNRDEQRGRRDLAGSRIVQGDGVARPVREHFLPRPMFLTQHHTFPGTLIHMPRNPQNPLSLSQPFTLATSYRENERHPTLSVDPLSPNDIKSRERNSLCPTAYDDIVQVQVSPIYPVIRHEIRNPASKS